MTTNPSDQFALVEAEVDRRTAGVKVNAWLLWFFLGGFNAHLAYLYPRHRWVILLGTIGVGIGLAIVTLGLSIFAWPLLWLLNWIPLLGKGVFTSYRTHIRAEVEADMLRRRALYGQQ